MNVVKKFEYSGRCLFNNPIQHIRDYRIANIPLFNIDRYESSTLINLYKTLFKQTETKIHLPKCSNYLSVIHGWKSHFNEYSSSLHLEKQALARPLYYKSSSSLDSL